MEVSFGKKKSFILWLLKQSYMLLMIICVTLLGQYTDWFFFSTSTSGDLLTF